MKGLYAPAMGLFLSFFLTTTVTAVPADTSNTPKPQQGITNAKKAMQSKLERDKQVRKTKEKGSVQRQQVQSGK